MGDRDDALTEFHYTNPAQEVLFGVGILTRLGEATDHHHWRRLMLCTIPRFQTSGLVSRLTDILGSRLVVVYAQVQPHVPQFQVEAAANLALEHNI
ncbi:MAG TPA: iron-containing alcohol dehydrogenase, partial [Anaerolineales bacterium]|nr:iron-containing alcohol dehydrogenase [Anaerolineales bacterium]